MAYCLFVLIAFFGFMLPLPIHAERLTNGGLEYSFDFPHGWTVDKTKSRFTVVHPDGSSFEGFVTEVPEHIKSAKIAALMNQFIALASGLCNKEPAAEFELSNNGWHGYGYHCNNEVSDTSPPSQMIGFTVKQDEKFYQFILHNPRQDWKTGRKQYLSLFDSLRFTC